MSKPTPVNRAVTYERDQERCASCGARRNIEFQHRRAEGAGGRLSRPSLPEGITTCHDCNGAYEGILQRSALFHGWKVRGWVLDQRKASDVPVFYSWESQWYLLDTVGRRHWISERTAEAMMLEVYGDEYWNWRDE